MLVRYYFSKNPLPGLSIRFPGEVELSFDWEEQFDYTQLQFPEPSVNKRFRGFMKEMIKMEFEEEATGKTVMVVSHGCAIEELANYFVTKWEFTEDYCALAGFKREGSGEWQQIFAGRSYYEAFIDKL